MDKQEGNFLEEENLETWLAKKKKKKKAIRFHLPCGLETAGDRKGAVGDMKICGGDNGLG